MELLDPINMITGGNVSTDGTVSALGKSTFLLHDQWVLVGIAYMPDSLALATGGKTNHEGVPSSLSVATATLHYDLYIESLPLLWRRGPSFQPSYLTNRRGISFNVKPPRKKR